MKKVFLITMMMASVMFAKAQNYLVVNASDCPERSYYCAADYDGVVVYAGENLGYNEFWVVENGNTTIVQEYDVDSVFFNITVNNSNLFTYYFVDCYTQNGDGNWVNYRFFLFFFPSEIPLVLISDPFNWKRTGTEVGICVEYTTMDEPYSWYYDIVWSNGVTNQTCLTNVIDPGMYSVTFTDKAGCASITDSIQIRNNVELYRATVDLETNLNKVTWQVTPEQAEYISEVKVERDGFVVGTVPYEQGYFMDNIGSENAARNYRLTGITPEGTECPIPSYQKGTLHVDYSPNASNPNKLNMAWTPPFIEEDAPVSVTYFQICKYDPTTGEVTVIDQLGANNTIASYNRDLFEGGYAVIGVVFNDGRADEEVSFSNRSEDIIMAVGEQQGEDFRIYPNPAQSRVTIEGTGKMTVTNTLGQTILTKDIDGKETIELPQGMYFVKMNGVTRKVVVE